MKKVGKPYIAEILEHEGKTALLPIPSKLRELMTCAKALGLKDKDDEDDLYTIGYKTLYIPEPVVYIDKQSDVERTGEILARLNEEQVCAIGALCRCFHLSFCYIMPVLNAMNYKTQEDDRHDNI